MKVVLTGGPHAGKTTLLRELERRGHRVVPEAAIEVIAGLVREFGAEQARSWRLEHTDEFQARIAARQLALEAQSAVAGAGICFYDRGLLDGLAYCRLHRREPPAALLEAVRGAHYDLVVMCELVLPFSSREDTGRTSDLKRAHAIEQLMAEVYGERGMQVVRLPLLTPADARAQRLLDLIAANSG